MSASSRWADKICWDLNFRPIRIKKWKKKKENKETREILLKEYEYILIHDDIKRN